MAKRNPGANSAGRFAYEGLDRVIHEKARLSIMTSLAAHPRGLLFNDLKTLCALTDGNLSRHLRMLHDAGLVEVWKNTGKPQTLCRLSDDGRQRFLEYVGLLKKVVDDARDASDSAPALSPDFLDGWSPA